MIAFASLAESSCVSLFTRFVTVPCILFLTARSETSAEDYRGYVVAVTVVAVVVVVVAIDVAGDVYRFRAQPMV